MDPFTAAAFAVSRPADAPAPAAAPPACVACGCGCSRCPGTPAPPADPFAPDPSAAPPAVAAPAVAAPAAPPAAPPAEWRVDNADGRFEVYGALDGSGVFRWTARRPRFYVMPAAPRWTLPFTAAPAPCAGGRCPR